MKKHLFLLLLIFTLVGCSKTVEPTLEVTPTEETITTTPSEIEHPIIVIELSNDKTITCELYPEVAPISVENFLKLVDSGYYNGTVFHRVIQNFMIQTGGYALNGKTIYPLSSTSTIKGEFSANGVKNDIKHEAGVLSMARATPYDSGSSQFFICTATSTYLDGQYAAFGRCVDNQSILNAIEISYIPTVYVNAALANFPSDPVSIVRITRK